MFRSRKSAEKGLLQALGFEQRGNAYHGGPVRYKRQTVSICQDGKLGVGTNLHSRRLRLSIAQQDRVWALQ